MTAGAWVRRTRRRLALLGVARAAAWSATVLFAGLAVSVFAGMEIFRVVALIAAISTLAVILWRERFIWSVGRVALWLEERFPELRYALVTGVDDRYAAALAPHVEPMLGRIDAGPLIRRAALRSVFVPIGALALAVLAFAVVPQRSAAGAAGSAASGGPAADAPSRLEPLRGMLTPPPYALEAGVEPQPLDEPTTIKGLAGSTVEITGPGMSEGLSVQLGDSAVSAEADDEDGQWLATFTMPDSATALRLADRDYRRLIVLAPVSDRRPTVQLTLPERDTTVREPTGSITLEARLTDDVGLASARFEYIIASGDSEGSFTAREGVLGARRMDGKGVREESIRLTTALASLQLKAGDQLTVRAVAVDNNDWNGPGVGYSEPRTLRVARPGEYDSLAVDPAPPPADSMLMTLRYLIQLTERLDASRDKLERQVFVDSSVGLGRRAERLRVRVQQLQADHTMGGMFAPHPLLATAYLALTEGEFALKVAETGEALPHLWDALHALQQYAWAERYYLRGRSPDVLVDLARVRLTGTDTGYARVRSPRPLADTVRLRLRTVYGAALDQLSSEPDSAQEKLALLQIEALRADPALADALGAAVRALQTGGNPEAALQRSRTILDGHIVVADTLPRWSGGW